LNFSKEVMERFYQERLKNSGKTKKDFMNGAEYTEALPSDFSIELVNGCISRCVMCDAHKEKIQYIGIDFFKEAIEKIAPYCKQLTLSGYGEPLMHPEIKQILNNIKSYNIALTLCTNAILLDRSIIEILLDMPNSIVRVSLDATRRDTYKSIRGVDCFNRVISNIKALLEAKKTKRSGLQVMINFIVMRQNAGQMICLLKMFKNYDVSKYIFNRLRTERTFMEYLKSMRYRQLLLFFQKCEAFKTKYNRHILKVRDYAKENNIDVKTVLL